MIEVRKNLISFVEHEDFTRKFKDPEVDDNTRISMIELRDRKRRRKLMDLGQKLW